MKTALVLIALAALSLSGGKEVCADYVPPDLSTVVRMGCDIQEHQAPDKHRWWQVHVWTKDAEGNRWQRLFAMREITQRAKALDDCDAWLRCIERSIRKERRQ